MFGVKRAAGRLVAETIGRFNARLKFLLHSTIGLNSNPTSSCRQWRLRTHLAT